MKAADVVIQLRSVVPQYTNRFTDELSVVSLKSLGTTITVDTGIAHGRSVGDLINIIGASTPAFISSLSRTIAVKSIVRDGEYAILTTDKEHKLQRRDIVAIAGAVQTEFNASDLSISEVVSETSIKYYIGQGVNDVATGTITLTAKELAYATTTTPHDLTEKFPDNTPKVQITGANEADYNGSKELIGVIDANNFVFKVENEPPAATGTPRLLEIISESYNGIHIVASVPTASTLTYIVANTPNNDAEGSVVMRFGHRITRTANLETAILSYEKQSTSTEYWAYVALDAGIASKDRGVRTDATATFSDGTSYSQYIITPFSIYVFTKASNQIDGGAIRDEMHNELLRDLCRSILGVKIPSPFSESQWAKVVLNGYDMELYNKSYYIQRYDFETTERINSCDIIEVESVALREVEMKYKTIPSNAEEFAKIDVIGLD